MAVSILRNFCGGGRPEVMAVAEQQSKPNSIALLTESPYSSGLQLLEGRYIDFVHNVDYDADQTPKG